jgi:NADH-quinone oxidoreductase subunit E
MSESVEAIVDKYQRDKGQLVSILQDIQAEYHYLPKDVLVRVCELIDIPLSQIYSVATFFRAFSLKPRGRHLINVCLGTACHVRGATKILEKVERELGISRGETTDDLRFTLETVNCLGCCALGPVMVVDDEYHGKLPVSKVEKILASYD